MASKLIQVSSDNITYYTLPGNTGDFNTESATSDDGVFGQSFASTLPTLLNWNVSTNSLYKGFAGYVAKFNKSGTSTTFTLDPMSLVSGKTYAITNATKNVWNRSVPILVYGNAILIADTNYTIDHLFGRITFASAYTPTTPITVSGAYLPMSSVGTAREFSLSMGADTIDSTDYATAQSNGGYSTSLMGLRNVSLDSSGFFAQSNGFKALLASRAELIVEINPDGSSLSAARGFFRSTSNGQSGDNSGVEDESITFELSVPDQDNVVAPFKWLHATSSTLSPAVQAVLNAWQSQTLLWVKYLHDGTNGFKGQVVVTDTSLSSSVDGINEFSLSMQGSGAWVAVP